jgi:hypothetical protein
MYNSEYLNENHLDNAEEPKPTFSHSIKIEETAKGCRVSVHVYADTSEHARQQALKTYCGILDDLKRHDITVAPLCIKS